MPLSVKVQVPETLFRSWQIGPRKVIILPKNRTTRRITWGSRIELNDHRGLLVVHISSHPTIRDAVRKLGDKFLSAQSEEKAVALWQRSLARTKPNGDVFAFHVIAP